MKILLMTILLKKKSYFEDNTYNYNLLPKDCRSNSSLENYNKYLKENLGKKKKFILVKLY